jgi:transposase InsO family protein
MCQVLGISASGYYAWCRRSESAHAQRDRRLRVLVRASFEASKQRYGSPRIHEDLLEQDERVSRKRVIRLMQEDGLKARARKRFKCTTMSDHDQPVAANLLDRQFTADAPNRRWVGDTTEFASARAASSIWRRSSIYSRGSSLGGRSAPSTTGI